jgi:hypothetical protein
MVAVRFLLSQSLRSDASFFFRLEFVSFAMVNAELDGGRHTYFSFKNAVQTVKNVQPYAVACILAAASCLAAS